MFVTYLELSNKHEKVWADMLIFDTHIGRHHCWMPPQFLSANYLVIQNRQKNVDRHCMCGCQQLIIVAYHY